MFYRVCRQTMIHVQIYYYFYAKKLSLIVAPHFLSRTYLLFSAFCLTMLDFFRVAQNFVGFFLFDLTIASKKSRMEPLARMK